MGALMLMQCNFTWVVYLILGNFFAIQLHLIMVYLLLVLVSITTPCLEKICHIGLSKILGVLDGASQGTTEFIVGMELVESTKWQRQLLLFKNYVNLTIKE